MTAERQRGQAKHDSQSQEEKRRNQGLGKECTEGFQLGPTEGCVLGRRVTRNENKTPPQA